MKTTTKGYYQTPSPKPYQTQPMNTNTKNKGDTLLKVIAAFAMTVTIVLAAIVCEAIWNATPSHANDAIPVTVENSEMEEDMTYAIAVPDENVAVETIENRWDDMEKVAEAKARRAKQDASDREKIAVEKGLDIEKAKAAQARKATSGNGSDAVNSQPGSSANTTTTAQQQPQPQSATAPASETGSQGATTQNNSAPTQQSAPAQPSGKVTWTAPDPHYNPCTINFMTNHTPYVESRGVTVAPQTTAGIWQGDDSVSDGSYGYFIGHHPGVFNWVMEVQNGDTITVCDHTGRSKTYHVIQVFDIPNTTYWEQLEPEINHYGESVVLQTCNGPSQYRIVVAD